MKLTSVISFLSLFVFLLLATPALAQESAGLGIAPSLIEEPADPGQTISDTLTIKNLSDIEVTYYLFTRDISDVTDSGRPLYAEEGLPATGYELSSWVTLSEGQITIPPQGEKQVAVTIAVPTDASPGSHFGAIFASVNPPDSVDLGAAVGFQVANIVSIRVAGDATEKAVVRSFQTDKFLYGSKTVDFTANLENRGNVLVRPRGAVDVYNMFGSKVASVPINESLGGLFPNATREFATQWADTGLGFGKYAAELSLVYGEQGKAQSSLYAATTFWVLPWAIIRPLLIALAVLFIVSYFVIRGVIRKQVQQLSGGRRLVRKTGGSEPSIFILATITMLIVTAFVLFVLLLLFA